MLVISKMEAGEKRANVCRSLGLAPATVSTIMASAKNKIKQSAQKTTKLHA
jgi:transcriptional regulator